jgi:hypothetical protein
MRSLAAPVILVTLGLGLIAPSTTPHFAVAPVTLLSAPLLPNDSSIVMVTLVSHALTPLMVTSCGVAPVDASSPGLSASIAAAPETCPVIGQAVMPGDTVTYGLPTPAPGRYRLRATLSMTRASLPPLEMRTTGDTLTIR